MNHKATNSLHAKSFPASFETLRKEPAELISLRRENDFLKKSKADLSSESRRSDYEKKSIIRKQKKQIDKLQQEVNALKVILSGAR